MNIHGKIVPVPFNLNTLYAAFDEEEAKALEQGVTITEADVPAFQAACADLITDVANRNDMTKSVYEAILSCR